MKKNHLITIVLILILVTAILTNPSQERHKETLKNELKYQLEKTLKEYTPSTDNPWEKFGQALGMVFVGVLVDKIVDTLITSDNYVFFSLTKISLLGESKVIGIGLFGKVFILKDLKETTNDFKLLFENEKK